MSVTNVIDINDIDRKIVPLYYWLFFVVLELRRRYLEGSGTKQRDESIFKTLPRTLTYIEYIEP